MRSQFMVTGRNCFRSLFGLVALLAALMSGSAQAQQVVISQIYGGGGNTGATFNRDFVELHNRGATPVAIAGYSLQYQASTGSTFNSATQMVRLTGAASIPAGGYFLVATTTTGTVGAAISADLLATVGNLADLAAAGGKVYLVNNQTLLTPNQHALSPTQMASLGVEDFVGYGQTNVTTLHSGYDGRGPAPVLSATLAAFRKDNGCQQTHDNQNDFASALPAPRNLASTTVSCTPTGACCVSGSGLYTTSAACASAGGTYSGDFTVLGDVTYALSSGTNPIIDISGTGTLLSTLDNSDDGNVTLTLPVPFNYYGRPRTSAIVNVNGIVKFTPRDSNTGGDFTPAAIPTLAAANEMVAPLWVDLFNRTTLTGGHVYAQQLSSPNRFVVQWKNVSTRASTTVTPDNFDFQTILYQDTGAVEHRYGTMTTTGTTPAITATAPTIGIENQSGTAGPTANPIVGFAALSGTSYLFTPVSGSPCALSPAPAATGLATPSPVLQGNPVVVTAAVSSVLTPPSTGLVVTADLSALGGSSTAAMLDDGVLPDAILGDGVYTLQHTIGLAQTPGAYVIPLAISDAELRTGSSSAALTVVPPPPVNDTCAGAIALTLDAPVSGTTAGGANDYGTTATTPPYSGLGQVTSTAPGLDAVFSFTAPSAGSYSVRLRGYSTSQNPVLYSSSTCPPTLVDVAANRTTTTGAEELMCLAMTSGQQTFLFVDDHVAANAGSAFVIEVNRCFQEVEPNGTPATATAYAFPMEGSIGTANELDFYALGTLSAGDRIFAMTDGLSSNTADWRIRVTNSTDTLEFDDDDGDAAFGASGFNPVVGGAIATAGPMYINVGPFSATTLSEPYRLSVAVQPPLASATLETEPNDVVAQANPATYATGTLSSNTDVDEFSFTADAGALVFVGLDCDPLRDNTAIDGQLALLDAGGATLVSVNGSAAVVATGTSPGTFLGTVPAHPSEGLVFRILSSGTYIARVATTTVAGGDYLLSVKVNPPSYCSPVISTPCSGNEFISNVTIGAINNTTACGIGLEDFTSLATTVSQGASVAITITTSNAFSGDSMNVYVDWNQNGVLNDAGEVTNFTFVPVISGSIAVPPGATLGATRMRVRLNYEPSDPLPGPCGNSTYGNIEDYTLIVTGPTTPANDTCANASPLSTGTLTGNITFATNDGTASCDPGGAASKDVWYSFTNGAFATTFSIDSCSSTFDTVLSIYDACGGVELACSDDCGGSPCGPTASCITLALAANQTIKIRLSDKGLGGTNWTLNVANLLPPTPNDDCTGAILVTCGSSTPGATNAQPGFLAPTLELPSVPTTCSGVGNAEVGGNFAVNSAGVWYRIVGTGQTVYADTLVASYDTSITVFTGSCGALTCVTVNDDVQGSPFHSKVGFQTVAGQDYYILVHGFGALDVGTFTLNVTCDTTPANDLCSGAAAIGGFTGTFSGTNVGATGENSTTLTSTGLASCATNYTHYDTWYSYTPPCDGTLAVNTCGTFDTVVSIHSSCPGATSNQLACNQDGAVGCAPGSELSGVAVTAGVPVLIRVATNGPLTDDPSSGGGQAYTLGWTLTAVDTDGDLTPDCLDGCPLDPLKIAPGICGCGTPDTDTDGDGTPDCNDGCPNDPLKIAPGICGCGTPDTDTDGDATPDCIDGCPNDPLKIAPGICGCGTPDTDTDGDGTPDCIDGCPNDPLKIAPGVCGCGTPDTDTDGDGTPNCIDGCPNDPLKIAPGICGCGTPETDTDNDGTPDCIDGCPTDPTKIAPGVCGCGTPDTDTDGDGVADCIDNCDLVSNATQLDGDNDGVGDLCDNCVTIANASQADCDNDGIGDVCAIAVGAPDCNLNGVPDTCDIASMTSSDANTNGIPDECEVNGGTPYCFGYSGCPCGNNSTAGSMQGCVNSSGLGTRLIGAGLSQISSDSLVLSLSNLPPPPFGSSFVLYFQGTAQANLPFQDGKLCVGGSIIRMAIKPYTGSVAAYPAVGDPAVHLRGSVPPTGGVRNYQAWHRDTPLPCGTNSNLSNGLSVIWIP